MCFVTSPQNVFACGRTFVTPRRIQTNTFQFILQKEYDKVCVRPSPYTVTPLQTTFLPVSSSPCLLAQSSQYQPSKRVDVNSFRDLFQAIIISLQCPSITEKKVKQKCQAFYLPQQIEVSQKKRKSLIKKSILR